MAINIVLGKALETISLLYFLFFFFFSILLTLPLLPFLFPSLFSAGRDNAFCREDTTRSSFRGSLTGKSTVQENSLLGNALRCRWSRKDEICPKKDKQSGRLEQHGRRKREGHCGWVRRLGSPGERSSCRATCTMHCSALGHTAVSYRVLTMEDKAWAFLQWKKEMFIDQLLSARHHWVLLHVWSTHMRFERRC